MLVSLYIILIKPLKYQLTYVIFNRLRSHKWVQELVEFLSFFRHINGLRSEKSHKWVEEFVHFFFNHMTNSMIYFSQKKKKNSMIYEESGKHFSVLTQKDFYFSNDFQ